MTRTLLVSLTLLAVPWGSAAQTPAADTGVSPVTNLHKVAPDYPDAARGAGLEGEVVLEGSLDAVGRVIAATVVSGPSLLHDPALRAVRQWRYTPATLNARPVPIVITITMRFTHDGSVSLQELIASLQHADEQIREAAARTLAALGPGAAGAASALELAAGDESERVRTAAANALTAVTSATRVPAGKFRLVQIPSEVARRLADLGAIVPLQAKGKASYSINKDAPTFAMPGGVTTAAVFRLPEVQERYVLRIASFRRGAGRTTEVFIPRGVFLDAEYRILSEFTEASFAGEEERVETSITLNGASVFGEKHRAARFVLLYTIGQWVGERMDMKNDLGLFNIGLFKLQRSLEARLEVETKPEPAPRR